MVPELFNAKVAQQKKMQTKIDMEDALEVKNEEYRAEQLRELQSVEVELGGTTTPENMMEIDEEASFNKDHPQRKPDDYSEILRNEACSTNPLDAFAPKPLKIFFESQHKSEQILLVLRKHPITLIPHLLGALGFGIFPLLTGFLGYEVIIPPQYLVATVVLWYLFLTGYLFEVFLTWFFYVFIITDERIIDVDFMSLIYKKVTVAKIDNIEDISAVTGGAIRSIFNFGTVDVQTASANAKISFEDVPQPGKVKQLLNELIIEEEKEKIEGRVN